MIKDRAKGHSEMLKILAALGGDVVVVENEASIPEQTKFFELCSEWLDKIQDGEFDADATTVHRQFNQLLKEELPLNKKKDILAYLAVCKNTESLKVLEAYQEKAAPELKNEAKMALNWCKTALRGELTGTRQVFISTGLGGSINRFRYFVCLFAAKGVTFAPFQRDTIEKELHFYLDKEVEFESLEVKDQIATMLLLVPIKMDVSVLLREAVDSINVYGNFLNKRYLITNTQKWTDEMCLKFMNEDLNQED